MKKFIAVLSLFMCFLMIFAFAGCKSDSASDASSGDTEKEVVLSDVLDKINSKFSVPVDDMTAIETTDDLELYYNIAPADVKQFAAQTTKNTATDISEIILVEAVDSDAAQRVYDALEYRYSSQRDLCASYSAELLAIINKCSVEIDGNFVSLIMSDSSKDITDYYNSLI